MKNKRKLTNNAISYVNPITLKLFTDLNPNASILKYIRNIESKPYFRDIHEIETLGCIQDFLYLTDQYDSLDKVLTCVPMKENDVFHHGVNITLPVLNISFLNTVARGVYDFIPKNFNYKDLDKNLQYKKIVKETDKHIYVYTLQTLYFYNKGFYFKKSNKPEEFLFFNKQTNKFSMTVNNKSVFNLNASNRVSIEFLTKVKPYITDFTSMYLQKASNVYLSSLNSFNRNSLYIHDVLLNNYKLYSYISPKQHKSLKYYFNKYGTKVAKQKLYNTTSKHLIKLFEKAANPMYLVYIHNLLLNNCKEYKDISVEKQIKFFTGKDSNSYKLRHLESVYSNTENNYFEISLDTVEKLDSTSLRYIKDMQRCVSIYPELKNSLGNYSLKTDKDVKYYHDLLVKKYNILRSKNKSFSSIYTQEELNTQCFNDQFELKLVNDTDELVSVANEMDICVGSYVGYIATKQGLIYVIYHHGYPICCVEAQRTVGSLTIQQVKLFKNNILKDPDSFLSQFVLSWLNSNSSMLYKECYDLKNIVPQSQNEGLSIEFAA